MRCRWLAVAIGLGLGGTPAWGQTVLEGRVEDGSGLALARAEVVLQPLGRNAVTDRDGRFRWRGLAPGRYRVLAARIGYAPAEVSLTLGAGDSVLVVVRLEASPLELPGLEASASIGARDPSAVIQATTQLSGRSLEREVGGSIAQTLRYQPGVAVRFMGPGAAAPVLRGLTGDRVLMLQDGQRSADLSGSADDHGTTADPLAAQRVEVVRGPATLLYGNNALGGVVNVISGDVASSIPHRAEVSLAAHTESAYPGGAASVRTIVPLGAAVALTARAGGRSAGDMRIGADPVLGDRLRNTAARSWNGAVGLSRVSGGWTAGAAVRGHGFAYGLPVPPGAAPVSLEGSRREVIARAEAELGRGVLGSGRLDGTVQDYGHDELDGEGAVQQRFALATRTLTLQLRQRATGPLRDGAWGVSLLEKRYAATGPAALTPSARSGAWGLFGFQELGFGAGPSLQLGARIDEYSIRSRADDKFGPARSRRLRAWSGSAGLRQELAPGVAASFTYARSFRAPTVEELFSGAPHAGTGAVEYGNAALRAERGASVEGLVHVRRSGVQAQLAVYRNRIDDYIALEHVGDTLIGGAQLPVYVYGQQTAVLRGAEGSTEFALGRTLALGVRGDVLHAARTSGLPLSFMPPARLGAHLRWDDGRFALGGELHHEFAQLRVGAGEERPTPAHTLLRLDAAVRLRIGGHTHSLTLRAENLTDELHREATSRIKDWAPAAGRNIALGYRAWF
ncbi:MAG TPA: TonB-dependent receptor [Longimicrobiales bacterium]|nr:TonB-dependent receptor [Longimicrobiales bacterium]